MVKQEQAFWRNDLRIGCHSIGHVNRVESHSTSIGVPDLEIQLYNGPQWWIELKVANPKVRVRPAQKLWHRERARAGGNRAFLLKSVVGEVKYAFVKSLAVIDHVDPEYWLNAAEEVWIRHINWNELEEILRYEEK